MPRFNTALTTIADWTQQIRAHLPHMSLPHARVLAQWTFGMVTTSSVGLTTVSAFLAEVYQKKENTLRQRLREFYREAERKKGRSRRAVDVDACFPGLLRWVLGLYPKDHQPIVLAMDTTTLGDRFTVLVISAVFPGGAIPVAWRVVYGNSKGAWRPHWEGLFNRLNGIIPHDRQVLVMADRGLYARWLFDTIVSIGWHPFLRINHGGTFRRPDETRSWPLTSIVPQIGTEFSGPIVYSKQSPLSCTLLGHWEDGYKDPWLVVTDLQPKNASIGWYGMRCWIECGFKHIKSSGWQWQNTKISDAERMERLWLLMAVASIWTQAIGAAGHRAGSVKQGNDKKRPSPEKKTADP